MREIRTFSDLEKIDSLRRRKYLTKLTENSLEKLIEETKKVFENYGYYTIKQVEEKNRVLIATTRELQLQRFIYESKFLGEIKILCRELPVGKKMRPRHIDLVGQKNNTIYLIELKYKSNEDISKIICQVMSYYCYVCLYSKNIFNNESFELKGMILAEENYYKQVLKKVNEDLIGSNRLLSILKNKCIDIEICKVEHKFDKFDLFN